MGLDSNHRYASSPECPARAPPLSLFHPLRLSLPLSSWTSTVRHLRLSVRDEGAEPVHRLLHELRAHGSWHLRSVYDWLFFVPIIQVCVHDCYCCSEWMTPVRGVACRCTGVACTFHGTGLE